MTTFPYYVSEKIRKQFLSAKKKVERSDQDRVYLITGREGSGKSLLGMQFAFLIDNNFNLDDIAFNSTDFAKLIRTTKKKVIVFDEAFTGLSSRGAMSKENKKLVSLLIECRQRNLFIFIILPSIFLLELYIAISRSSALFHTSISKKNYQNRYYKSYNLNNKRMLYILGKKYMSYSKPYINEMHRFYGKYPPTISKEEYIKKKIDAFKDIGEEKVNEDTLRARQRNFLLYLLNKKYELTYVELEKLLKEQNLPLDKTQIGVQIRKMVQEIAKNTEKK